MKPTAGLPLSVGQASLPVRLVIASVFLLTGCVCIHGGRVISSNLAARVIAVLLVIPVGLVGLIASAFVLAPRSRFGRWLDELVPRLREPRVALVTALLFWAAAIVLT